MTDNEGVTQLQNYFMGIGLVANLTDAMILDGSALPRCVRLYPG
jgi:hypothetical protein